MTLVLAFLVLLALGMPIAMVLGSASLVYLLLETDLPLVLVPQRIFTGIDVFVLMAVPLFILAGLLMSEGGITERLVRFCQALVGHLRGGLAQVNTLTCMFFGGISGAAAAEAAAVGVVLIPMMKRDGYREDFASALTASASVMGPIIPPSIPMLVYGIVSGTSIGALFLAGVIPGVLIGLSFMVLNHFLVGRGGRYQRAPGAAAVRFRLGEVLRATRDGILALIMPLIIVYGIVGGAFTPTEAAGAAVFYALVVAGAGFRSLSARRLPNILLETGVISAVVMIILAMASLFSWILTAAQIPQAVSAAFLEFTRSRQVFFVLLILLLLFMGTFLEPSGAIIIITPVLLPIATRLGIDPVHLGAVLVIGMAIGLITPPVGLCLFVVCSLTGLSLERISYACLPFLAVLIVILVAVAFFPPLTLWLPRLLMG